MAWNLARVSASSLGVGPDRSRVADHVPRSNGNRELVIASRVNQTARVYQVRVTRQLDTCTRYMSPDHRVPTRFVRWILRTTS